MTQNIDGLHQAAGSKRVYELHGSTHRNICQKCGAVYSEEWILQTEGVPTCPKCGGRILKKTSRNGYTYYGCDKFPTCDFMTWNEPTTEKCPAFCASSENAAVSRGPVVQYRSKKPRI